MKWVENTMRKSVNKERHHHPDGRRGFDKERRFNRETDER